MFPVIKSFYQKNRALFFDPFAYGILARTFFFRLKVMFGMEKPEFVRDDEVLVISCHHKVMTTYFTMVLRLLSMATGRKFQIVGFDAPDKSSQLLLSMLSAHDFSNSPRHRLVHIMRDPRDVIVSGYHYHKWTYEKWAHKKEDGLSYQERLNAASRAEGLFLEIDRWNKMVGSKLVQWPMDAENYLEVRFEDLMSDEREDVYTKIFRHLGLDGKLLDLCTDYMRLFEAKRRTGKASDATSAKSHIRKATSGQWKNELDQEHRDYIEDELGGVLQKFGYENDSNWVAEIAEAKTGE